MRRPVDRQACRCFQCRARDARVFDDLARRLEAMPAVDVGGFLEPVPLGEWAGTSELVRRIDQYGWSRRA